MFESCKSERLLAVGCGGMKRREGGANREEDDLPFMALLVYLHELALSFGKERSAVAAAAKARSGIAG